MAISIPASKFRKFIHFNKTKRWGQAFYDYLHFSELKEDWDFLDALYHEPDEAKAKAMVRTRLDYNR